MAVSTFAQLRVAVFATLLAFEKSFMVFKVPGEKNRIQSNVFVSKFNRNGLTAWPNPLGDLIESNHCGFGRNRFSAD